MSLKDYHLKRNFKKTPEPKGILQPSSSKKLYVIQKHDASHLHYDFRLELNGVLKSWAIPKGPCLDPSVKRLAVQVEDHPLDYGEFEGIIPAGEYGAGTVMLLDKGEWVAEKDAEAGLAKGHLIFRLKGKKLKGLWALIRFKRENNNWFLIKLKDKYTQPLSEYDITIAKSKKSISNFNIKITNPNKLLYPQAKITKQEFIAYYYQISKWILPFISNRPLMILRCPNGNDKKCFHQKHVNESTPKALHFAPTREDNKITKTIYIDDIEGLLTLAQMATLEIHPWGSKVSNIEHPDYIIFDLDPAPDVTWKQIVNAAFLVRDELKKIKLESFVKTTGGKGLHVTIPIKPEYNWDKIKNFSHVFVDYMVMKNPQIFIATMSKSQRTGKIFLDYLRNQRNATAIAPYSTRITANATIAVPLDWNELTYDKNDTRYTIKTIFQRLSALKNDPWKDFYKIKQSLAFAFKKNQHS